MQRPKNSSVCSHSIELSCNGQSIWIELCDHVKGAVHFQDTGLVGLDKINTGEKTAFQAFDKIFGGYIDERGELFALDCI